LRFDVKVRQPQSFRSQRVEPRRRRTANDTATVEAGLAPTEVVHKDEHNVWFILSGGGRKERQQRRGEQNFDGRCTHFHIIVLFFCYSSSSSVVE
jgi:mannose-6-phosphate isomerase-like protein (cupin superfamily)